MTTLIAADTLPGGKHWSMVLWRNSRLKLTDVEGGANVGMLFYNPLNLLERYNAPDTLKCQHTFKLTRGPLPLLRHGPHLLLDRRRHVRLARHRLRQHDQGVGRRADGARRATRRSATTGTQNGHDSFLVEAAKYGLGRRDLAANVNWFSKVVVADDGAHVARRRAPRRPGASVELRFEMDTLVLFHTCPHPLSPAPSYPRKPCATRSSTARRRPADDACRLSAPENGRGFENNRIFHIGCCAGACTMITESPLDAAAAHLPQGRAGRRLLDARRRARARRCASSTSKATRPPTRSSSTPTIRPSATRRPTPSASRATSISPPAPCSCPIVCRPMLTITADTVGRHDTLGGACATREQHRALRARQEVACTPAATASCSPSPRTTITGSTKRDIAPQHQFLHERAGDARRRPARSPTVVSAPGKYVEMRRRDGRHRADLELPAAQQSLQRLQPDADRGSDLGRAGR